MLFEPYDLRGLPLKNRMVMAPMTRNRATAEHVPTPIMVTYYAERADLGLLITEGTSPAPDGLGYARIPGLYSDEQVAAWKPVTAAVHAKGSKIFAQLMHTGRASNALNLPAGARVVGPMAVALPDPVYTDAQGLQPATMPHALTEDEVRVVVAEYAHSATKAIEAGFDGIELHAANGYLIEQFLNANHNQRTDAYGGSADARNRFALEVATATAGAIGPERVGIRLSPYGTFNDMGAFVGIDEQFVALAKGLSDLRLVHLHLVDHASMGSPNAPASLRAQLRTTFNGTFIASGGFDCAKAEAILASHDADLVAFGRLALANPDLVTRLQHDAPLNAPDVATFYTPGEKGYTDYPALSA
ncbi:alkene reductase [Gemmatimonas sp.]|uniref:alkene reductase n=1 Tax=Gemmatimonas sp. TaxID=1962908 RepID=UPI0035663232